MFFDDMKIEKQDLTVDNIAIFETLNGRNWTDFKTNRITLTTPQVSDLIGKGCSLFIPELHFCGDVA